MKNSLLSKAIRLGIVPRPGTNEVLNESTTARLCQAMARDAAPLVPNNGIPEYLLNIFNPEVFRVILAPLEAENIFGTVKKGALQTKTTTFIQAGTSGDISSYGDFSQDASVGTDYNFPGYDSWAFQSTMKLGDLQAAEWGEAKINALGDLELSMADIFKRSHNKIWFFGVNGLRNYGILTDPRLPATVAPIPNTGGDTEWPDKTALEVYNDIKALKGALNRQSMGNIKDNANMKLVLSTNRAEELLKTNEFGITVMDRIKKVFPNLEIVYVPEYTTAAGEVIQLIATEVQGKRTGDLGYTELIRSHGVVRMHSSIEEKKSAGNWGAIIYYPLAIATMLGI